jgi:hypothetical protein
MQIIANFLTVKGRKIRRSNPLLGGPNPGFWNTPNIHLHNAQKIFVLLLASNPYEVLRWWSSPEVDIKGNREWIPMLKLALAPHHDSLPHWGEPTEPEDDEAEFLASQKYVRDSIVASVLVLTAPLTEYVKECNDRTPATAALPTSAYLMGRLHMVGYLISGYQYALQRLENENIRQNAIEFIKSVASFALGLIPIPGVASLGTVMEAAIGEISTAVIESVSGVASEKGNAALTSFMESPRVTTHVEDLETIFQVLILAGTDAGRTLWRYVVAPTADPIFLRVPAE